MPSYECYLSAADQWMPPLNVPIWLIFEAKDPESTLLAAQRTFDQTVKQLPFLSGHISQDRDRCFAHKLQWQDDNPEVPWEDATTPDLPTLDQLRSRGFDSADPPMSSLPTSYLKSFSAEQQPALIAAYAKVQGGLLLFLAFHHALADAGGFAEVLSLWAANSKGVSNPTLIVDPQEPLRRSERLKQIIDGATKLATDKEKEHVFMLRQMSAEHSSSTPSPVTESMSAAISSGQTADKVFMFSVRKLDLLRKAIRQHTTKAFSLNTMLSALLWVTWINAYTRRLKLQDADLDLTKQASEFFMGYNPRNALEKASLLTPNSWMGNLAKTSEPEPRIDLEEVLQGGLLSLDVGGKKLDCSKAVPASIDRISAGLAEVSKWQFASMWNSLLEAEKSSDFSYNTVRDLSPLTNGFNMLVSNWATLDLLPDFGGEIGRPLVARTPNGASMIRPGTCIMFPRHRDAAAGEELLDRLDAGFGLKTDDLEVMLQDETLKAVFSDEFLERTGREANLS